MQESCRTDLRGGVRKLIFPFCAFSQDLCDFPHIPSCNLFTFNHL